MKASDRLTLSRFSGKITLLIRKGKELEDPSNESTKGTALLPYKTEKLLSYLMFFTGFFGAAVFAINIGIFTLFAHRILLVLLWMLFTIRILTERKVGMSRDNVRPYLTFYVVWIVYAVLSLLWAEAKADCIRYIIFLFMGISLVFFAIYYFQEEKDLKRLYWMWFGAFWILILIGFWEHTTGNHLPVSRLYNERMTWFWNQPTGVYYNPNDYATFLAISMPFMFGAVKYIRSILIKVIGIAGMVIALYLIVITGSRANIIAVLVEATIFFLFFTNFRQKFKIVVPATLCFVLAFNFLPLNLFSKVTSAEIGSLSSRTEVRVGSVAIRSNLIKNCMEFVCATAGIGVGAGNVEHWMEKYGRYSTQGIVNAHNWWIEILTNYGIFIFIGFIVVYIGMITGLLHCWHRENVSEDRMIGEVLLLSMLGFAIACISSSSIMAFEPNWILFAFALVFLNQRLKKIKARAA